MRKKKRLTKQQHQKQTTTITTTTNTATAVTATAASCGVHKNSFAYCVGDDDAYTRSWRQVPHGENVFGRVLQWARGDDT